jgi:hypothetical protein
VDVRTPYLPMEVKSDPRALTELLRKLPPHAERTGYDGRHLQLALA